MMASVDHSAIASLAARLTSARRVTVLTGAGVSAASGVPTFRGPDGFWKHKRAEDLATAAAFGREPQVVWEWYAARRAAIARCEPNAAHHVLARWSLANPACRVMTQNVDDLHLRAGTARLLRLHGSLWELSCFAGCEKGVAPWHDEDSALASMRTCRHCGGLARPAVVWFGETLDASVLEQAVAATACDLFLTVGTSAVVFPAAGFVEEARRRGAFTVEINPEPTPVSGRVDLAICERAEVALPAVDALLASSS